MQEPQKIPKYPIEELVNPFTGKYVDKHVDVLETPSQQYQEPQMRLDHDIPSPFTAVYEKQHLDVLETQPQLYLAPQEMLLGHNNNEIPSPFTEKFVNKQLEDVLEPNIPNAFSTWESFPSLQSDWTRLGDNGVGSVAESQKQEFLWGTMVTSIPSLLVITVFSVLLIYIILKRLRDIMELYLSVLAYALSMVSSNDVLMLCSLVM
eukprot:sb/3470415/